MRWAWGLCLWLGCWAVQAQEAPLPLVQRTAEQVLAELKAHKAELQAHPERIRALVEDIVLPHFDFERMSRLVLGRYWRSATPEQRRRFVKAFRNLLVRTYASALLEYSDQRITYGPVRGGSDEVTVHTEVAQPGGLPIPIDYRLYRKGGRWRAFDVIIDGVSLVANYRSTFSQAIRKEGLDALIRRIEQER